jgi:hypothetical protein
MKSEKRLRGIKSRAFGAILALLLGFVSAPASLILGSTGDCEMACCLAHGDGDGEECCALNHAAGNGGSDSLQTVIEARCPASCSAPPSSAQFFPSGVNRGITSLSNLADSLQKLPFELERVHQSLSFRPTSPRAPPSVIG